MFSPGERVAVGCSGGADSSCLLHVLAEGLREWSLSLVAVYVDHGLRDDTRAEREWVRRLAGRCGAEYVEMKVDVPARVAATGESVQEAARELRYEALRRAAAAQGARRIAVGHTLTDQAETVLMQALRGAGLRGLWGSLPSWATSSGRSFGCPAPRRKATAGSTAWNTSTTLPTPATPI